VTDAFSAAYDNRPLNAVCGREIEVCVVGDRCVYVNNHRVAGGKPYVSENLPTRTKSTTVREVLDAFNEAEILAYLAERREVRAYCAGVRAFRDAAAERECGQ
jgi:hypothetical protein